MKATQKLHDLGQSLWLDNITRDLLDRGTLERYIEELSVTGLTSNPTIFDHAIANSAAYDAAIRTKHEGGKSGEQLFFELALEDLTRAADLFRPIYERTNGVDGWVSLEVSPLLAYDTASTLAEAKRLYTRAARPNVFIKIPGTAEGVPAIEEAIFAGVPINVTLLFSREHYLAAAEAFMRGIERRVDGRAAARRRLGCLAVRQPLGRGGRERSARSPAQPARHRDGPAHLQGLSQAAQHTALAAPLQPGRAPAAPALGEHRDQGPEGVGRALHPLARRALHGEHDAGGDAAGAGRAARGRRAPVRRRRRQRGGARRVRANAGIDLDALAARLQREGADSFAKSWHELLAAIEAKSAALGRE